MHIYFTIFFFVFGTIIGSFLNVVLYRFNTGKTLMGRSRCFSCRRNLSPIDLVPVLSYISFGGKCRTCKSRISIQYPLVELATGILFAGSYMLFSPVLEASPTMFLIQFVYTLIIMSLLVLITVYDMRHKIIPDMFVFTFIGLSFSTLFLGFDSFGNILFRIPDLLQLASGFILAFPFYFLWLISDGRWMGFGDAKLAVGFGWFLGLSSGATAIVLGFWIGAAVSLLLLGMGYLSKQYAHKKVLGMKVPHLSLKSEVPFAPFLIAGLLIVFFFRYNLFESFAYLI
ncbi:MAG: prepilin peptidase [Candidatus Taylorbacteria bacterium]|nr:prepilin peptidase [Candidatus Taylorbacteria bacterium]